MRKLSPPRRGTWRPGQTNGALFVVQVVSLIVVAGRGLDYLRRDNDPSSVLSRVQDTAPLPVWGAVFLAAATIAAVGLVGRWGTVIAVGHILAMLGYASISFGLFQVTGLGPGFRTPWGLAGAAIIHGALGIGLLALLRRRELIASPPPQGP